MRHAILCLLVLVSGFVTISFGYIRPSRGRTLYVAVEEDDHDHDSLPQQVHISLAGRDMMKISWITDGEAPPLVKFGTAPGIYNQSVTGSTSMYRYMLYKSGQIHEAVIGPLQPDTLYYYRCSGDAGKEYSFKSPPAQLPIKFAVVGDLGQSENTESTLKHIEASGYHVLLLPGDLAYANTWQPRWDNFGRLVEPLASQQPWMVTNGNHEIEKFLGVGGEPFKAYNARWRMPYEESNSTSNLYYSFDAAGVHVVMLSSYTEFDPNSDQYKWLQADLVRVDRNRTPWLFVLFHVPWYNTNVAHQREGEKMRGVMEGLFYDAHVDAVFAGHVHGYERFGPVHSGVGNSCGPVHITVGVGGNGEGLATEYLKDPPAWSLFREARYGHGQVEVVNATHAKWEWHRNDDDANVAADEVWLTRPKDPKHCV